MKKKMRVAEIVPVSCLEATKDNQYHMCLAHLVLQDQTYAQFYARMVSEGKFVMMDNGAAEGSQLTFEKLLEVYDIVHPTEIVLPDTLYEPGSTIQRSRNFMNVLSKKYEDVLVPYRLMAVPQGRTLDEWVACARIFIKDTRINSLGVSKFLNIVTKDRYIRFKACAKLEELFEEYDRRDMEVHLLGCDEGPKVVKMASGVFSFVRGCDSAFAYLQAQAKKMMTDEDDSRPEGTIDFLNGAYINDLDEYIENFNQFAGAIDNGVDASWQ